MMARRKRTAVAVNETNETDVVRVENGIEYHLTEGFAVAYESISQNSSNFYGWVSFQAEVLPYIVINQDITVGERQRTIEVGREIIKALQTFRPSQTYYVALTCSRVGGHITRSAMDVDAWQFEPFNLVLVAGVVRAMQQPKPLEPQAA